VMMRIFLLTWSPPDRFGCALQHTTAATENTTARVGRGKRRHHIDKPRKTRTTQTIGTIRPAGRHAHRKTAGSGDCAEVRCDITRSSDRALRASWSARASRFATRKNGPSRWCSRWAAAAGVIRTPVKHRLGRLARFSSFADRVAQRSARPDHLAQNGRGPNRSSSCSHSAQILRWLSSSSNSAPRGMGQAGMQRQP